MRHDDAKTGFLNRREWASYLSALQVATSYPRVLEVVKTGRAWFIDSAAQAQTWMVLPYRP